MSDKIVALKLPPPLCVASGTPVRQVLETVQRNRAGAVLVCQDDRPVGIMTEQDVLMKIVARDVKYSEPVDKYMTPDPFMLNTGSTVGEAITLMNDHSVRNIPIVDEKGIPVALLRIKDIIIHLAESFPEQVVNLPPRPHQQMMTPEGA